MKLRFRSMLVTLMLAICAIAAGAQDTLPRLAVNYQYHLYVLNGLPASAEDLPALLTPVTDELFYGDYKPVWSPDGTKLLYAVNGISVWDGTQLTKLAHSTTELPQAVTWTPDGRILYLTAYSDEQTPVSAIDVFTIAAEAGAVPEQIADDLPLAGGCYGSSIVPMDYALWDEMGGGTGTPPLLALTDAGLVYPGDCFYGARLYRFETGESVNLPLSLPVLSPDGTRLAGNGSGGELQVINLATLETTTLVPDSGASLIAWGNDGSLYYTTLTNTRDMSTGFTAEELTTLTDMLTFGPAEAPANIIGIFRVAPDGSQTLLAEHDAYGVGRMTVSGNTLLYSTVANGDVYYRYKLNGTINSDGYLAEGYPEPFPVVIHYIVLSETGTILDSGELPPGLENFVAPR